MKTCINKFTNCLSKRYYIGLKLYWQRYSFWLKIILPVDFPLNFKIVILNWPRVGCLWVVGLYFIGKSPCTTCRLKFEFWSTIVHLYHWLKIILIEILLLIKIIIDRDTVFGYDFGIQETLNLSTCAICTAGTKNLKNKKCHMSCVTYHVSCVRKGQLYMTLYVNKQFIKEIYMSRKKNCKRDTSLNISFSQRDFSVHIIFRF